MLWLASLFLPACRAEDDDNCYWNAQAFGNHRGQSFIALFGRFWSV